MTERRLNDSQRRRLEQAGAEQVQNTVGKLFWRLPGEERLLPGNAALKALIERESEQLMAAGWTKEAGEGEPYWRKPDSGRLYPHEAAIDLLSRREEQAD